MKHAMLVAGLVALVLNCGCERKQPQVIIVQQAPTPTPIPTLVPPPFTGQGAPPPIGTPGASSPIPPVAGLPAPAADAAKIQQIVAATGIVRIYGSKATGAMLDRVWDALRRFPRAQLRGLEVCCEPAEVDAPTRSNAAIGAYWNSTSETAGKMYLWRDDTSTSLVVHEAGHHVTLMTNTRFGNDLLTGLGYRFVSNGQNSSPTDPYYARVYGNWDKSQVPASAYNADYARQSGTEHLAELVAVHLTRGEMSTNGGLVPGFAMPPAAQGVLQATLGPTQN